MAYCWKEFSVCLIKKGKKECTKARHYIDLYLPAQIKKLYSVFINIWPISKPSRLCGSSGSGHITFPLQRIVMLWGRLQYQYSDQVFCTVCSPTIANKTTYKIQLVDKGGVADKMLLQSHLAQKGQSRNTPSLLLLHREAKRIERWFNHAAWQ